MRHIRAEPADTQDMPPCQLDVVRHVVPVKLMNLGVLFPVFISTYKFDNDAIVVTAIVQLAVNTNACCIVTLCNT